MFFFTGPMWIGWTRPKIMSWVQWFERWPVLGLVGGFAEGYLPLVDDYFYCECACLNKRSRYLPRESVRVVALPRAGDSTKKRTCVGDWWKGG